jgi:maltose-binding protein MalE
MSSVWTYLANAVAAIYNQTADPTTALTEAAAGVRAELGG